MTMKSLFAPGARTAVALATLIGSAAVLSACGQAPSEVHQQRPASTAGALTVQSRTVTDLKPVAGEITTRQTAEAMTRTGGTLIRMSVREGDVVRAGQVIGFVRDERIALQTAGYDALVRAAEAESDRAAADLGRTQSLFEKGIYAQARLDQMREAGRAGGFTVTAGAHPGPSPRQARRRRRHHRCCPSPAQPSVALAALVDVHLYPVNSGAHRDDSSPTRTVGLGAT